MWNCLSQLSTNLLHSAKCFTQIRRTVFILERTLPTKLSKLCAMKPRKLKRRDFYYRLVENTDTKKKPPLELVLTKDLPGVGMRGEKIEMNMYIAYRDLLLPKLAIYASSAEAQDLMKISKEKHYSSIYSKIVENYLASQTVSIILSSDVQWTLEPWHVKLALRKNGILTREDCISIPQKITGPNTEFENRDFLIYLTMNKSEVFPVRCRIYHWSTLNPSVSHKVFNGNSPSEPLFPNEKEKIESLLMIEQDIKKMNKMKIHKTEGKKKVK